MHLLVSRVFLVGSTCRKILWQSRQCRTFCCSAAPTSKIVNNFQLRGDQLKASASQTELLGRLSALQDELHSIGEVSPPSLCELQSFFAGQQRSVAPTPKWKVFFFSSPTEPLSPSSSISIPTPKTKGLLIWGGVGQGKTVLMDSFFDTTENKAKKRVHFHEFMLDVHTRLHRIKKETVGSLLADPLIKVAWEIRQTAQLLCFDELHVVHITDAMILRRLFEGLIMAGCVVVTTSNRPVNDLYLGGLNRSQFMPFINLLKRCCHEFHIETNQDFRLSKSITSLKGIYNCPSRSESEVLQHMDQLFPSAQRKPVDISVAMGRIIRVEHQNGHGVAAFSFTELCASFKGTSDYLAIAGAFHTIFLHNIPSLANFDDLSNEIRRFINLVDILYEKGTRVIFDVAESPFRLFGATQITKDFEHLRICLKSKSPRLQDDLNRLAQEYGDKLSRSVFADAVSSVSHCDPSVAQRIFEVMYSDDNGFVTVGDLRKALFFHALNYDYDPPSQQDEWFFSEFDGTIEVGVGYELYYDAGSSSKGDNRFAHCRTVSRIREMISAPYIDSHQITRGLGDIGRLEYVEVVR